MDIVTLAAAKKYTDDKLISGGNGGAGVDSTLTISGAAADAKVVGDKLLAIEEMLLGVEALIDESGVVQYDTSL